LFYYNISLGSIIGNGLWQNNMTVGTLQNSKQFDLLLKAHTWK